MSNKFLNPRAFIDCRDTEHHSHHRCIKHIGSVNDHEYSCSHSYPGRSTGFADFAAPRPCTTEGTASHHVGDLCPRGDSPVREHHYSDPAGKYLNIPEFPSRRGTGRAHAHYPAIHDGHRHLQDYNPHDTRPQDRSIQHYVESSSGDSTRDPSKYHPDWSEAEDNELIGVGECGSPLTVNSQPSKPPISDEWRQYCKDLDKKNESGVKVFRCTYPIVQDNKPAEPCNFERAKSTVIRHIYTVHLNIR
jgi:hypothetical protein